jgi:hypothetical protein
MKRYRVERHGTGLYKIFDRHKDSYIKGLDSTEDYWGRRRYNVANYAARLEDAAACNVLDVTLDVNNRRNQMKVVEDFCKGIDYSKGFVIVNDTHILTDMSASILYAELVGQQVFLQFNGEQEKILGCLRNLQKDTNQRMRDANTTRV